MKFRHGVEISFLDIAGACFHDNRSLIARYIFIAEYHSPVILLLREWHTSEMKV